MYVKVLLMDYGVSNIMEQEKKDLLGVILQIQDHIENRETWTIHVKTLWKYMTQLPSCDESSSLCSCSSIPYIFNPVNKEANSKHTQTTN